MSSSADMRLPSGIKIPTHVVDAFLGALPPHTLKKLAQRPANIPGRFPLAFPSQLHETNVHATLAVLRPTFTKYAAALRARKGNQGVSSGDTLLRGVMGMYLTATSEAWNRKNPLSAIGMLNLSENQLSEYFDCPIMVEREHETMKGITVGERGGKLLGLIQEVKEILKSVNPSGVECLGEAVEEVVKVNSNDGAEAIVDKLSQKLTKVTGVVQRSAAVQLLQVMAETGSCPLRHEDLNDFIPLDIPPSTLIVMGLLDLSETTTDTLQAADDQLQPHVATSRFPNNVFAALTSSDALMLPRVVVQITAEDMAALQEATSSAIHAIAKSSSGQVSSTEVTYILANYVEETWKGLPLLEVGVFPSKHKLSKVPVLSCSLSPAITFSPSESRDHPLDAPILHLPAHLRKPLDTAAAHLRASRTVSFPTETVYGLGASTISPSAVAKVYKIKGRPSDNPLIIHVSSLDMLRTIIPAKDKYEISELYLALIDSFWPGPLTLLFPSPNPPPLPAPQTTAIRMPAHPLARALISHSNLPISAPSANSSGRPSPTSAQHVFNDLQDKSSEGLGCILDGGECGVGVESTVVDGLGWRKDGCGFVDILRPGGLGVEAIERVVREVDVKAQAEGETRILLHGKPWPVDAALSEKDVASPTATPDAGPSTPGQKYRHYSPRIPVFLLLPSNIFPPPTTSKSQITPPTEPRALVRFVAGRLAAVKGKTKGPVKIGLLHFESSPLAHALLTQNGNDDLGGQIMARSLGQDAESAARNLFSGMLDLEGALGADAIFIEGCSDQGLGLAVMERAGKAVGGGGRSGELDVGEGQGIGEDQGGSEGRFWVQV